MKIKLTAGDSDYTAELDPGVQSVEITECFNGVMFVTADGEGLAVSMRDSGFEVFYYAPGNPRRSAEEADRHLSCQRGTVTVADPMGRSVEL